MLQGDNDGRVLKVAIIGRPNVGKSTLFNRLIGRRLALVDDTPGVTRDWRAGTAQLGGTTFTVIDTAGLEDATDGSLEARMRRQTEQAVASADVVLFLIDARAGVTPFDHHFARWLHTSGKPVILAANKAEGRAGTGGLIEAFELGLGEPLALSAEHGEGLGDLYEALEPHFNRDTADAEDGVAGIADSDDGYRDNRRCDSGEPAEESTADEPARPVSVAIVGRPNVGKSTLLNALIGQDRVLTGPEAGMTRDAITVPWRWQGREMRLVDTAGLRRKARIDDELEKLATSDALRSVRMAQVVVLVLDGEVGFDKQDLTIARLVVGEGRALVIAANKWDTVINANAARKRLTDRLEISLPQVRGVRLVTLSATREQGLDRLMAAVFETYDIWNRRIPTSALNQWLMAAVEHHPPPLVQGRPIRLRYMTQIKSRPPTFALWINKPLDLPDSYTRYLVQGLRDRFEFPAVPIRLMLRKGRNPFARE